MQNQIILTAGVMAMLAFPAFADKTPVKPTKMITVQQCELMIVKEQVSMLNDMIDQAQANIKPKPKPVYKENK